MSKSKFIVMVTETTNDPEMCYDTYNVEYSGIRHRDIRQASKERDRAISEGWDAWIKKVGDE